MCLISFSPHERQAAEPPPNLRARRGPGADGDELASVGRVALAHGDVGDLVVDEAPLERGQLLGAGGERDRVRAARQRAAGALTGGVDQLRGLRAGGQVAAHDAVVDEGLIGFGGVGRRAVRESFSGKVET